MPLLLLRPCEARNKSRSRRRITKRAENTFCCVGIRLQFATVSSNSARLIGLQNALSGALNSIPQTDNKTDNKNNNYNTDSGYICRFFAVFNVPHVWVSGSELLPHSAPLFVPPLFPSVLSVTRSQRTLCLCGWSAICFCCGSTPTHNTHTHANTTVTQIHTHTRMSLYALVNLFACHSFHFDVLSCH